MNTPHPYLDLNENPCVALFRLLQLIRDRIQEKGAFDLNEANWPKQLPTRQIKPTKLSMKAWQVSGN